MRRKRRRRPRKEEVRIRFFGFHRFYIRGEETNREGVRGRGREGG